MTASMWRLGGGTLRFESVNDEGQIQFKDGLAELEGN
jgi:hypothetical protein